jgi:hypothetical protein
MIQQRTQYKHYVDFRQFVGKPMENPGSCDQPKLLSMIVVGCSLHPTNLQGLEAKGVCIHIKMYVAKDVQCI